jgi:hypothetical protein
VGVQWHPEQDDDLRLFAGLVDAALEYRSLREPGSLREPQRAFPEALEGNHP